MHEALELELQLYDDELLYEREFEQPAMAGCAQLNLELLAQARLRVVDQRVCRRGVRHGVRIWLGLCVGVFAVAAGAGEAGPWRWWDGWVWLGVEDRDRDRASEGATVC